MSDHELREAWRKNDVEAVLDACHSLVEVRCERRGGRLGNKCHNGGLFVGGDEYFISCHCRELDTECRNPQHVDLVERALEWALAYTHEDEARMRIKGLIQRLPNTHRKLLTIFVDS